MKTHHAAIALLFLFACNQATEVAQTDAGGTGVAGGSGGAGERAGGMSTCTADEIANSPQTTTRRILPWTLVLATASGGAGGLSGDGGTGGSSGSGCTVQGGPPLLYQTVACQGTASVRSNTGALELIFDDSSILRWDTTGITNPVQPPVLTGLGSVWVDYSNSSDSACGPPMCATFTQTQLSVRDREGGSLLWVGREGDQADDVSDALVSELFGVAATKQALCQFEFTAECQDTIRTVFDHVLQTAPVQRLQPAQLEHVVTPTGQYQVVWAYSEETHTPIDAFCDAVHLPHDRGFAASRM